MNRLLQKRDGVHQPAGPERLLAERQRLVGLGLVAGLLAAWLSRGMIESFFRVQPFDATTLGLVASTILGLALLVSVRPALRAARVDLGAVLNEE